MSPCLAKINTVQDVQQIVENPLASLFDFVLPIVKVVLRRLREPQLIVLGVDWKEVLPIIKAVSTVEESQAMGDDVAKGNFGNSLEELGDEMVSIAKKFLPLLAPVSLKERLHHVGLEWDDLVRRPVLEKINTVQDVKTHFHDPMAFIEDLAGPIAKQKLEDELSKRMESGLQKGGLTWRTSSRSSRNSKGNP